MISGTSGRSGARVLPTCTSTRTSLSRNQFGRSDFTDDHEPVTPSTSPRSIARNTAELAR
jgi:hypothetical protein